MSPRLQLRRAARVAGFGAVTALMLPAFVAREATAMPRERDQIRDRWVGAWASALLSIFGVTVQSRGARPPHGRGHLVVANHRSTADILLLLRAFGGHMVSRADLAGWPLVGPAARAVGTVFVDRTDAVSGATAVRAIRSRLAQGSTVIVFPEGTTFPDDEVRPFHAGAFVAALHSGADIVPVGIAYAKGSGAQFHNESFTAHLSRMAAADPSPVAMCVGGPIAIGQKTRAARIRDEAHVEVQRLVHEARRMVDARD
ncbi:MAG TPA: lysophospholipid acyltransferase family protein [Polyangiaceae bacterium]|nr:lysophospholipid acyltransferase family protein [Polyangiaceae bacterium]